MRLAAAQVGLQVWLADCMLPRVMWVRTRVWVFRRVETAHSTVLSQCCHPWQGDFECICSFQLAVLLTVHPGFVGRYQQVSPHHFSIFTLSIS